VLDDAPPLLGVRGALETLMRPSSRSSAAQRLRAGLKFAGTLARDLGGAGFVIASGLARGIDQARIAPALRAARVAMLAGGHDRIYPPSTRISWQRSSVTAGPRFSEMPMGTCRAPAIFPRRNRLISGAALASSWSRQRYARAR